MGGLTPEQIGGLLLVLAFIAVILVLEVSVGPRGRR